MPPAPFLLNERVNYPYGIACLSAFLKAHGHKTTIVHPIGNDWDALEPLLDADLIGVSVTTPLYKYAKQTRSWLCERKHDLTFVLGGPHATGMRERCLDDGWDAVVVGEGELALLDIIEHGTRGVVRATHRIAELGYLPFPDLAGAHIEQYAWDANGHKGTDLHTARGCVHSCRFCNSRCSWGQRLYGYPAWYVKRLIDQLHQEYGFRGCFVQDDAFPFRRTVFQEVTDYFVQLGWVYRCQLRANQMNEEMAKRLRDTGCIGVGIGIESMVQSELDTMNKGTTVEHNRHCLELCSEYQLPVTAYLMLGVPGQTYESAMHTYRQMLLYRPERVHPGMLCPYPGTAFYDERETFGIHFRDGDEQTWIENPYKANPFETLSPVYTDWMTIEEIENVKDTYWKQWNTGFYEHDKHKLSQ